VRGGDEGAPYEEVTLFIYAGREVPALDFGDCLGFQGREFCESALIVISLETLYAKLVFLIGAS
jgi:hypothetical protein